MNQRASLAALVVLPEPCRPAIRTTVGGRPAKVIFSVSPPRMRVSSALTILTTCWLGSSACDRVAPIASVADAGDDVAGDADVDVGLEQGGADLPHDLVDVGLGQAALAAQPLDDALEADGEVVEHARPTLPARPPWPFASLHVCGRNDRVREG